MIANVSGRPMTIRLPIGQSPIARIVCFKNRESLPPARSYCNDDAGLQINTPDEWCQSRNDRD